VIFREGGIPYRIFESTGANAGVWNKENKKCGSANSTSSAQIDPVCYSPPGWFLQNGHAIEATDPLRGIHTPVDTVLKNTQEIVATNNIEIEYNRKVIAFYHIDDAHVSVTWEDTQTKEQHTETFAGVHFRTGSLSKVNKTTLPNEDSFQGQITIGCWNQAEQLDHAGKTVIINGWGSFAIENIVTALRRGAKKVHVVSRNNKPHWFDYATYSARQFYSPNAADPAWLSAVWESIFNANEIAASACGVEKTLYSPDVYTRIDGKRHCYLQGGIIGTSFDPVAIAMHYGLVEYHQGAIADVRGDTVVLDSGDSVKADLIIKCTGFETDYGPLAGHYMHDSIFIDGHVNLTSFHGVDGTGEECFCGPCVPVTNSFLISIYMLCDFDRAIGYFIKNKDTFDAFKQFSDFTLIRKAERMGYIAFMYLFNKCFAFGDENIIGFFMKSMTLKQAEYEAVLDEQTFLKYDKMRWDAWAYLLAIKSGEPVISYPFIDRMENV